MAGDPIPPPEDVGVVTLYYSVPVEVEFDTGANRVLSVKVDDTNAVFTGRADDADGEPYDGDTEPLADAADTTSGGWPQWEIGL